MISTAEVLQLQQHCILSEDKGGEDGSFDSDMALWSNSTLQIWNDHSNTYFQTLWPQIETRCCYLSRHARHGSIFNTFTLNSVSTLCIWFPGYYMQIIKYKQQSYSSEVRAFFFIHTHTHTDSRMVEFFSIGFLIHFPVTHIWEDICLQPFQEWLQVFHCHADIYSLYISMGKEGSKWELY